MEQTGTAFNRNSSIPQTSFYYKYRYQNNPEAIFDALVVSTHTRTTSS